MPMLPYGVGILLHKVYLLLIVDRTVHYILSSWRQCLLIELQYPEHMLHRIWRLVFTRDVTGGLDKFAPDYCDMQCCCIFST